MSDSPPSPIQIKPDDQRPEHPDFWCKRFGQGVTPWDAGKVIAAVRGDAQAVADTDALLATLGTVVRAGDHVVFMSNGGFDGAPRRFLAQLQSA